MAISIVLILAFLFVKNFVMVPSQLDAVSFSIDESSVLLDDSTDNLNFVAKKLGGAGKITYLVFIFFECL